MPEPPSTVDSDAPGSLVTAVLPEGPVFGPRSRHRSVRRSTLVPALSPRDRAVVDALTVGWLVSLVVFWWWWLQPSHRTTWAGLVLNSALLLSITLVPGYFFVAIRRLWRVDPRLGVPPLRVAFVVTRSPSEAWPVARRTLAAMLAQQYPHPYDVWLCDEDPDDEVTRWCQENQVRLSCRRGVAGYHEPRWPRRTRCKEGNLAYFYDHWGYRDYDVVAQLDCDHTPAPTYLAAMVAPFTDEAVGYVAAPSVCDTNVATSWSARGRLYREAVWHGAIQLGHNGGLAPVCIGSHYAVRTRALRDIGGLGPELAEDFSTTFLLNSAGWDGVFAVDAEAHGDGPITFADMVTQEFQWSRSLTVLLYDLLPHHLHRLRWPVRLRFAFSVAYYPLLALTIGAGLALAPIVVLSDRPWVSVNYFEFIAIMATLGLWPLLAIVLLRRRGLLRPATAPVLSWEAALFALARFPYVVRGVLAATVPGSRTATFKVTPKSRTGVEPLSVSLVSPYLAITGILAAVVLVGESQSTRIGYVFLCLLGATSFAVVSVAVPVLHVLESARATSSPGQAVAAAWLPLLAGAAGAALVAVAIWRLPHYVMEVMRW